MNNLEALKSKIAGYPLSDNTYLTALIDHELDPQSNYAGMSMEFDLATADIYVVLATGVNITEGSYQFSITDKSNFLKVANSLYSRHGQPTTDETTKPTVTGISPW